MVGRASRAERRYTRDVDQDTSLENQRRYHALVDALSPVERLLKACSLSRAVRTLSLAGLRHEHPEASDEELRRRLVVRLYGRPLAERVYGSIPADAR